MVRCALILLVCLAAEAPAQSPIGFGVAVKGGLNTGGWFDSAEAGQQMAVDQSSNFTGGPALELRFADTFGVEADALYRKLGRDASGGIQGGMWTERERGSLWEFPVLAKVRLWRVARFRPFVAAGATFHRLRSDLDYSREELRAQPDGTVVTVRTTGTMAMSENGSGFTMGAGIERPIAPWRISIEGRYTRRDEEPSCGARCRKPGQFLLLVGFGF
ncbi:MAG TPA: outer membrane beta-barrel protein [Bryobacteraceae bacterium]|nr:outer membrane beta-barrel protein [Bryobacteraceae bacterium]